MKCPPQVSPGFSLCLLLAAGCAAGARGGETRCWFERGAVVAPAAFGPIAGDFIIDLSHARSQLHDTAARTAGFTGATASADLVVAGARRPRYWAPVVDLDARTRNFPTNIAGVLGADVFAPYVVELDFSPCRLRLVSGGARTPKGGLTLPLAGGPVPAVRAGVSDGVTSRYGRFALATGDASGAIANARLARPAAPGKVAAGRLRALSLGNRLFEGIAVDPAGAPAQDIDGAIGTGALTRRAAGRFAADQCPILRQTER